MVTVQPPFAGAAYRVAEPDWPEHEFTKLLEIAFGNGRLIDRADHPVLQQLLGHNHLV